MNTHLPHALLLHLTLFIASGLAQDFSREVQPILAEHCFACHGADKAESGLRLDVQESAFEPAESGDRAVVAGDVAQSTLLQRIQSDDPDVRMPPEGDPLTEEEIAVLRKWIGNGAEWAMHWAYRPLDTRAPPAVRDHAWTQTTIDQLVLARLESEKIEPSPEAPPEKLIRRLSYDLLGLPPSVAS